MKITKLIEWASINKSLSVVGKRITMVIRVKDDDQGGQGFGQGFGHARNARHETRFWAPETAQNCPKL